MLKNTNKIILTLAVFLIIDPVLRILSFKASTGMEWSLVWDNIIQNGNVSVYRFIEFWLMTPLAGFFLLTMSRVAYFMYAALTFFKFYSLMTYQPFEWPYFAARPHAGAFVIITLNFIFVMILMWPLVKKYLLSYYLKDFWDARGRYECNYPATLFVHSKGTSFKGYVKNISSGGVLFNLYEGKGELLKVEEEGHIVFELKTGEYLSFEIRLVNVSITDKSDHFGMEFTNVDPHKSLILMNILMELRSLKQAKEKQQTLTTQA